VTADPESEVRRDRLEPEVLLDGFKVEMPAPSAAEWVDYMATAYGHARGDLEKSAFQALIARTADPASLHLALGSRS
jgi:hypothetical protein